MPRPIPRLAPVISATLSLSLKRQLLEKLLIFLVSLRALRVSKPRTNNRPRRTSVRPGSRVPSVRAPGLEVEARREPELTRRVHRRVLSGVRAVEHATRREL